MKNFFIFLIKGEFDPNKIQIKEVTGTLHRSKNSEDFIEREWQKAITAGLKIWPGDTKPSRYRYVNSRVNGPVLEIEADPCVCYRDYIGSRPVKLLKQFGRDFSANSVTVNTLLLAKTESGQEQIMLTIRRASHDSKAGGYHASLGGCIALGETPKEAILREVEEESGLSPAEIRKLVCQNIIYEPWENTYAVNFYSETDVAVEKIKERKHDSENEIIFIDADVFLRDKLFLPTVHALVTAGLANILTLGRKRYDQEWFDEVADNLARKSIVYNLSLVRRWLENRDAKRLKNFYS